MFCGFQQILSVRVRLFVVVLNGSCGFAFVFVLFTEKGSSCVWHVLGWLGWRASFYAVNNQVSVAPRCFTLFHVVSRFVYDVEIVQVVSFVQIVSTLLYVFWVVFLGCYKKG